MSDPMKRPDAEATVPEAVADELAQLERVSQTLRTMVARSPRGDYGRELLMLRETLSDERQWEDRASIVEQMTHLKRLQGHLQRYPDGAVDPTSPYFGHLRLETDDQRVMDVMIGKQTFIRGDTRIVDWRHAPVAGVFYQYRAGDDYVMDVGDGEVEGEVLARRTVTIAGGELRRVACGETSYVGTDGLWSLDVPRAAMRGGAGTAVRPNVDALGRRIRSDKHLPEIASLLDPHQYEMITRPDAGLIAIQGAAGSGKTTVALHRVAYLAYLNPSLFAQTRTLIVVYSRALASYISKILPDLGLDRIKVVTVTSQLTSFRRRLFSSLPDRISDDTPSVVSRFKQHAALVTMLDEAAAQWRGHAAVEVFDELLTSESWIRDGLSQHAPGEFSNMEVNEIHRWCSHMHAVRDAGAGANEDDRPELDAEDDALLIRLWQLLHGPLPGKRKRKPLRLAHLVIDEVQDLCPLELAVLLDTVEPGRPVTLAGDTAQKLADGNDFRDWTYVLEHVGIPHVAISPLSVAYRSTAAIMEVAHHVLGHLAPTERPVAHREGAPVRLSVFAGTGESVAFLGDILQDLADNEPDASVALLTRTASQANATFAALSKTGLSRLRRVADQDFTFAPGIEVTEITQTKGLEFDYVVLLDVDAETYPPTDSSRHLLHVGLTRAAHMCWLICVGEPSPILPTNLRGMGRAERVAPSASL